MYQTAGRVVGAVVKRWQRPDLYDLSSNERVGVVYTAPSDMRIDERLFLYTLVRGLQPDLRFDRLPGQVVLEHLQAAYQYAELAKEEGLSVL